MRLSASVLKPPNWPPRQDLDRARARDGHCHYRFARGKDRARGGAQTRQTRQCRAEHRCHGTAPGDLALHVALRQRRRGCALRCLRRRYRRGPRHDSGRRDPCGAKGDAACQLGLGAPSRDWGRAAVAAIDAVEGLGGGQVTLSGTDLALQAPAGTTQAKLDEIVARLQAALPPLYSPTASIATGGAEQGPAEFSAVAADSGSVVLRGRITDQRMRDAVESFARSRFGQIDSALRLDPEVPAGWTVRVIAALEAMAGLENGTVHVSPELIRITGVSGSQTASDSAATALAERLGAGANYELAIRYNRRLDPLLGLPSGAECIERLNVVMRDRSLVSSRTNR
ncbi:hypothetical protein [Paracoccus cavernae]|uniref:hypothetical protein n=1 Tax=Paracoccus cavernae TaxID=1571207 RepID=UPI00362945A1